MNKPQILMYSNHLININEFSHTSTYCNTESNNDYLRIHMTSGDHFDVLCNNLSFQEKKEELYSRMSNTKSFD